MWAYSFVADLCHEKRQKCLFCFAGCYLLIAACWCGLATVAGFADCLGVKRSPGYATSIVRLHRFCLGTPRSHFCSLAVSKCADCPLIGRNWLASSDQLARFTIAGWQSCRHSCCSCAFCAAIDAVNCSKPRCQSY